MTGLSIKRNKKDGTYGVFKFDVAIFEGLSNRIFAVRVLNNLNKEERKLKQKWKKKNETQE